MQCQTFYAERQTDKTRQTACHTLHHRGMVSDCVVVTCHVLAAIDLVQVEIVLCRATDPYLVTSHHDPVIFHGQTYAAASCVCH